MQRIRDFYGRITMQYPAWAKVGRFLISGGTSLLTDLFFLYLFTDVFGMWYLFSAVAAFILAFFVSFGLHKFWTFGDMSRNGLHMQMGAYFIVAVTNLALNTALVFFFVEYAELHYLLAQIVASALIATESFFVYQHFIFKKNITS